eukprot:6106840-Pleurochrysis_carterae.AAC.1
MGHDIAQGQKVAAVPLRRSGRSDDRPTMILCLFNARAATSHEHDHNITKIHYGSRLPRPLTLHFTARNAIGSGT